MAEHYLKTWPPFFGDMMAGRKSFELRKDDRGYAVGDTLRLREYRPDVGRYTGAELLVRVTYVLRNAPDFGLKPGFCILQCKRLSTLASDKPDYVRQAKEERSGEQ